MHTQHLGRRFGWGVTNKVVARLTLLTATSLTTWFLEDQKTNYVMCTALTDAQSAKTWKKSPFWQDNAIFALMDKINVF